VTVKNTSARDGNEVLHLHVGGGFGNESAIRDLRGFQRIHLREGERCEVRFTINSDDLPKSAADISVGGGRPLPGIPYVQGTLSE
jgi:beta-glucosidase